MNESRESAGVRERILETADRLFYRDGIRAVGIDRIVAEANVAKMSLYKHFPSKDQLLLAVLRHREESFQAWFQAALERLGKRIQCPIEVFFAALKEWFETPDFRGCAFINAAVELADPQHPASQFVRGHKQRFAEFLRKTIETAIGPRGKELAPVVNLLVEGAIVTAVIEGSPESLQIARATALKLLGEVKG